MRFVILTALVSLAACSPQEWNTGVMPHDASSQLNLDSNRIVQTTSEQYVQFEQNETLLKKYDMTNIPERVDAVWIYGVPSDPQYDARMLTLKRAMRATGITSERIHLGDIALSDSEVSLVPDQYYIKYLTSAVVTPGCPRWTGSSTDNYLNEPFSNIGCATVTNMGRMVSDPHDMRGGASRVQMDPDGSTTAITKYKAGTTSAGASSQGGQSGSGSGSSSYSASGQ